VTPTRAPVTECTRLCRRPAVVVSKLYKRWNGEHRGTHAPPVNIEINRTRMDTVIFTAAASRKGTLGSPVRYGDRSFVVSG